MKLKFGIFLIAFAFVISCRQDESLKSEQPQGIVLGKVSEAGTYKLTANSTALKAGLSEHFKLVNVDKMDIHNNEKGLTIFEGHGRMKNGHYLTFGFTLTKTGGVGSDVVIGGGCTQTCESLKCCEGCTLMITSDCSGSCTCNDPVAFCTDQDQAKCKHTVTSGGGEKNVSGVSKTLSKYKISGVDNL